MNFKIVHMDMKIVLNVCIISESGWVKTISGPSAAARSSNEQKNSVDS